MNIHFRSILGFIALSYLLFGPSDSSLTTGDVRGREGGGGGLEI